jgi:hypothetical protein
MAAGDRNYEPPARSASSCVDSCLNGGSSRKRADTMITPARTLGDYTLALLPPRSGGTPPDFETVAVDPRHYEDCIAAVQRLRGRVYVQDGAIPPSALDDDLRHRSNLDYDCWHLLMLNWEGHVAGCIRVRLYDGGVDVRHLQVWEVVRRMPDGTRERYARAIRRLRDESLSDGLWFGEVGGWAVSEQVRTGTVGVTLAVALWPFCRLLGGVAAVATATTRHNSAKILTRLGGASITDHGEPLGPFDDPYFGCQMNLLGFDSRRLSPRYEGLAETLRPCLLRSELMTGTDSGLWTSRKVVPTRAGV